MADFRSTTPISTTGVDPLGIGIPDLGRSSYDPIQTARAGWEKSRQERLMKRQERREDYEQIRKNLPSFEGINQKVAGKLNQKAVEMGDLAYQRYKSGAFSPYARTREGEKTVQELGRLEQELLKEGKTYEALIPSYKQAKEFIDNPENEERIDWEETTKRMDAFAGAEDLQGMTDAAKQNLVVLKPEPTEFYKWATGDLPLEGTDKEIVSKRFDPALNRFAVTTKEYTDPKRVEKAMRTKYRAADDRMKREIQRRYDSAPQEEKVDNKGVVVDAEDWFVSQFSPQYGKKMDIKAYAPTGKGTVFSFGLRDDKGEIILPKEPGIATYRTETGKDEYTPVDSPVFKEIPLQGLFDKSIGWDVDNRTINTETGKRPDKIGGSSQNDPLFIRFQPIAKNEIKAEIDGKKMVIKPGSPIPSNVFELAKFAKRTDYQIEPIVVSNTLFKKTQEGAFSFAGEGVIPKESFYQQTIVPWNKVKEIFRQKAKAKGVDLDEDIKDIDALTNEFNEDITQYGVPQTLSPDASDDEWYNLIHGD